MRTETAITSTAAPAAKPDRALLVLAGVTLCLAVGHPPISVFTFGLFIKPLGAEFGWDRASLSAVQGAGAVVTAMSMPFVGAAVDRWGSRRVLAPAILLFALLFAALSTVHTLAGFAVLYVASALAGAPHSPMGYAKTIMTYFDRRRGLALGVAMAGVGLGSAVIPQATQHVISAGGWRSAYLGLALLPATIALPVVLALLGRPTSNAGPAAASVSGMSLGEALRTRTFWTITAAIFLVSTMLQGTVVHMVPLLTDRGISAGGAAAAAGLVGLSSLAGRILFGALLDVWPARYVAAALFLLPLPGAYALAATDAPWLGSVAIGLVLGAEVDLVGYMCSRYFGVRRFGKIYGVIFAAFGLGAAAGPFAMGAAFDRFGSYGPALQVFALLLAIASAAMLTIGPYRFAPGGGAE